MHKVRLFVLLALASLAALLYSRREDRKPRDKKDLNREINRWEGEGGYIPDRVNLQMDLRIEVGSGSLAEQK